mmetsp:Transcript_29284/g.71326  ORF Transcript_29284/g.71326 Transcript_29284/m.71326 type:complete len:262 (+) Transcript_29284:636-1421(+)
MIDRAATGIGRLRKVETGGPAVVGGRQKPSPVGNRMTTTTDTTTGIEETTRPNATTTTTVAKGTGLGLSKNRATATAGEIPEWIPVGLIATTTEAATATGLSKSGTGTTRETLVTVVARSRFAKVGQREGTTNNRTGPPKRTTEPHGGDRRDATTRENLLANRMAGDGMISVTEARCTIETVEKGKTLGITGTETPEATRAFVSLLWTSLAGHWRMVRILEEMTMSNSHPTTLRTDALETQSITPRASLLLTSLAGQWRAM